MTEKEISDFFLNELFKILVNCGHEPLVNAVRNDAVFKLITKAQGDVIAKIIIAERSNGSNVIDLSSYKNGN